MLNNFSHQEMQIKNNETPLYIYIYIYIYTYAHTLKQLKLFKLSTPSVGKNMEELELSYTAGRNEKWPKYLETIWQFLKKLIN